MYSGRKDKQCYIMMTESFRDLQVDDSLCNIDCQPPNEDVKCGGYQQITVTMFENDQMKFNKKLYEPTYIIKVGKYFPLHQG